MANSPLIFKSLDFEKVKDELVQYLKTKDEFKDFDFEGSNLNFITDALAYITNYNAYLAHATFNELLIDTVQERRNILSICKSLNYVPYRNTAARAKVKLQLTDFDYVLTKDPMFDQNVNTVVLPVYSTFSGDDNTSWITLQDYTFSIDNNWTNIVNIYQGVWNTNVSLGESFGLANEKYNIEEVLLDNNNIKIYVNGELWENNQDVTTWTSDSKVYKVFENFNGYYYVQFGDGVLGQRPSYGASIVGSYLLTNGFSGNGYGDYSLLGSAYIDGNVIDSNEIDNTAFAWVDVSKSSGGKDKESIEEIRINAPKFYASQGRAITPSDYEVLLRRNPLVEYVKAYGGEDLEPPRYGFIMATIKPPGQDELSFEQEQEIIDYLEPYHIKGIRFKLNPATFIEMVFDISVKYNIKKYTAEDITAVCKNIIYNYFNENLNKGKSFYFSQFIGDFDENESIISVDINYQTYTYLKQKSDGVYYYNFGQSIKPNSVSLNISETSGFLDDGEGSINNLLNEEIGYIDYEKGIIAITDFKDITDSEIGEKMFYEFESEDVEIFQNIILRYDSSNSTFKTISKFGGRRF